MPAYKKWVIGFFALLLAALTLIGGVVALIDPYFHYHAPLDALSYDIYYQRYQNDGIVKHFDYDAIITGNSMAECFKSSDCDRLFGVSSVKVPFTGATPKELDACLRTAFEHNENIRLVVMALDYGNFIRDKDEMSYEADDYPKFLYDKNPLNDVNYLYNKSIIKSALSLITRTRAGIPTTSFDDYSQWTGEMAIYGRDMVYATYGRHWDTGEEHHMNDERLEMLRGNIEQNYIETIEANPQTEFYLYFPPYSVLFWDKQDRMGVLELTLEAEREVIEMLLPYENVHLFSFYDDFELAENFEHYKDYIHHDPQINTWILECMAAGEHQLKESNYETYLELMHEHYTNYDFDALFE